MIAASSPNCRSPDSGVKSRHQAFDVVDEMRPLRMARDLRLLPGRQAGVEIGQRLFRLAFEPRQLVADRDGVACCRQASAVPAPWPRVRRRVFQNRDSFVSAAMGRMFKRRWKGMVKRSCVRERGNWPVCVRSQENGGGAWQHAPWPLLDDPPPASQDAGKGRASALGPKGGIRP